MPFSNFESIKTIDDLLAFFTENFPDAIDLIGQKRLINDFFKATPQYLVSVKVKRRVEMTFFFRDFFIRFALFYLEQCRPTYIEPNVLLMGDAAHAMVPFYGQGMNAGFEDCSILSRILDQHHNRFHVALKEFSDSRWQDAQAICDLAMYNYVEVTHHLIEQNFKLKNSVYISKPLENVAQ